MHRTLLAALATAATAATAVTVGAAPATAKARPPTLSPQVVHTGRAPTGYEVRFRYYDPTATSVQIRGEWYFSSPSTTTTTTFGRAAARRSAARATSRLRSPTRGRPRTGRCAQMTHDPSTGVWSYTTPLPSGMCTYGF